MTHASTHPADSMQEAIGAFLQNCLAKRISPEAQNWISEKCAQIEQQASKLALYTSFSAAPRIIGKAALALNEIELAQADAIRPLWVPRDWTADQAARCLILLSYESGDSDRYAAMVEQLFSTADERELVALYRILPLLPHPERFVARAAEGVRSNMLSVFHAVALNNPYPFEHFDEPAWNQLVLKVTFTGGPLAEIIGLQARTNAPLTKMLHDLTKERRAAGRSFPPGIWHLIARHATAEMKKDMICALDDPDPLHRNAAAEALAAAGHGIQTKMGGMPAAQA